MIEVFKTNVQKTGDSEKVIKELFFVLPNALINFDLEDVDNILRVEVPEGHIRANAIISLLRRLGFHGQVLADIPP